MAPVADSKYFPPLEKCFSGEVLLLSWQSALLAVTQSRAAAASLSLQDFLSDDFVLPFLTTPYNAFPRATAQTKSTFETKTAAIHVTPSENGHYDMNQIKEDTIWLSKETNIDEVSALRLVILEWQGRAGSRLLSGLTEEETLTVKQAAGAANFGASTFLPASSILAASAEDLASKLSTFGSQEQRRVRLLSTFLRERVSILRLSEILLRASLWMDAQSNQAWIVKVGTKVKNGQIELAGRPVSHSGDAFLAEAVDALESRLDNLDTGSGWFAPEGGLPEIEDLFGATILVEMIHILQLMFAHISLKESLSSSFDVLRWYSFLNNFAFFGQFEPLYPSTQPLLPSFQALVSLVSLSLLQLPLALEYMEGTSFQMSASAYRQRGKTSAQPYLTDSSTVSQINDIFLTAASGGASAVTPAGFAWSIIALSIRDTAFAIRAQRDIATQDEGSQEGAAQATLAEDAFETIITADIEAEPKADPIEYLAKSFVDKQGVYELIAILSEQFMLIFGHALDASLQNQARLLLLELIRQALPAVRYGPEIVTATLATLSGNNSYCNLVDNKLRPRTVDPVRLFLQDQDILMPRLLHEAQLRYPYELIPLLRLCKALCLGDGVDEHGNLLLTNFLTSVSKFTQVVPSGFRSYETCREDENGNYVRLLEAIQLFGYKRQRVAAVWSANLKESSLVSLGDAQGVTYSLIPKDALGVVIEEAKPPVATWEYEHSAFQYLSVLLSTALTGSNAVEFATQQPADRESASEIISLLATFLTATARADKNSGRRDQTAAALRVLEEFSSPLGRNQDIVTVVFDLFESELQTSREQPGAEGSLDLLISCTQFIHALTAFMPNRVWPFLARSQLLDVDGSNAALTVIVASTEMVLGRYDFLLSCVRVFETLIEDAVSHAVARRVKTKSVTRFGPADNTASGVPEKTMGKVILAFERIFIDVLESSPAWRFALNEERLAINERLLSTFNGILNYCYGFDDSTDVNKKLIAPLAPAAELLLEVFLGTAKNDLAIHPLLNNLFTGTNTPFSSLYLGVAQAWISQTRETMAFGNTLLSVGILLNRPTSYFETQIFKALPLLVRLYAAHLAYKAPVIKLLTSLVRSAVRNDVEPPSLLGYLGGESAKAFLTVLSDLGRPLQDIDLEVRIWGLLSAVVSMKQQWLAIYLLTGTTPRDSLRNKNEKPGGTRHKALLESALDDLSLLKDLPAERALAMLEFISLAQNYWSWAMESLRQHPKFINTIVDYLGDLRPKGARDEVQTKEACNQMQVTSKIAEILAMYLHRSRELGDVSLLKTLVPRLAYLRDTGTTVGSYNSSLHANLKRNLESKYSGCSLLNFKRTLLRPSESGKNYFYDLDFATHLLDFDSAWLGTKSKGFRDEVERANLNLSVVEAEIDQLRSWKLLAVELSNSIPQEPRLVAMLAKAAADCLRSNSATNVPQTIFERLVHTRTDFAFALIQKLVKASARGQDVKALFATTWDTVRHSGHDFDAAFAANGVDYYRSLLRILFLALQFQIFDDGQANGAAAASPKTKEAVLRTPAHANELVEILQKVVAQGFRSLANQLHEEPSSCNPSDFVLITAILQTVLAIPRIATLHSQIALQLAASNVSRYALSLFTWADQLAIDNDPIYGELSILFLLELSSVPVIAETLAVEGALTQISTANLSNYYRRTAGVGPFDEPTRLYSIWMKGILPLCLNLLDAVGAPMAAEVGSFLNQFPGQLTRAATCLDDRPPTARAKANVGSITIGMVSEIHTLSLIDLVIERFRAAGAAAGIVASDIAPLAWEKERAGLKEDIEGFIRAPVALRDRIIATNERELEMLKAKPARGGAESRLEEKILAELDATLNCLNALNGN